MLSSEIYKELSKKFTKEEMEIFAKIEAEKYKLLNEKKEIIEEPDYEFYFWSGKSKNNKNEITNY